MNGIDKLGRRESPWQRDSRVLVGAIRRIWERADDILAHPELSTCEPACATCQWVDIAGGRVTLGVLLSLWRQGRLVLVCPSCGGRQLVYGLAGSPSSARNGYHGVCLDCGLPNRGIASEGWGEDEVFSELWLALYRTAYSSGPFPRETLPLDAALDILSGGPGSVNVFDQDGTERYRVTWSPKTVVAADGSLRLTLVDNALVDDDGTCRYVWDGNWDGDRLHKPDGAPITEEERQDLFQKGRVVIGSLGPLFTGNRQVRSYIRRCGVPGVAGRLAVRNDTGLAELSGSRGYLWWPRIPRVFVHLLALLLEQDRVA